jgi:HNH endonuclease
MDWKFKGPRVGTRNCSKRIPRYTPCGWCFERWATVWDHMTPFSWGGPTEAHNLMPSCVRCNAIVGAKLFNTIEEKREYVRQRYIEKAGGKRAVYVAPTAPLLPEPKVVHVEHPPPRPARVERHRSAVRRPSVTRPYSVSTGKQCEDCGQDDWVVYPGHCRCRVAGSFGLRSTTPSQVDSNMPKAQSCRAVILVGRW